MFLQYYGLHEQPFGVTPDPRYLYASMAHREALASLVYSFESELGFASLIAGPGLGKTTLLYSLLERFGPSTRNAYIFETQCDSRELLRHILSDLDCDTPDLDMNAMFRRFRDLVAECTRTGRRVFIIIDEAQNLAEPALETVRLLSNFETSSSKLVHIVLAGQPQLAQILACPAMAQLRQRITIATRLRTFSTSEVIEYVNHRLNVAGYRGGTLFTPDALALIAQQSGGNPREINRICFNAMSLGFAMERRTVDDSLVQEAGADLDLGPMLATSAPRMLSPEPLTAQTRATPVPPHAVAPLPTHRRVTPPRPLVPVPERQPANARPVVTTGSPRSARSFAPAARTVGSVAARPQTATAAPGPLDVNLQRDGGRNGTAASALQTRAPAPVRLHVGVPQSQGRTSLKRAVSVGALLVGLTAMAVVFGGRLRSAKGAQPSLQRSGVPGDRSAMATAPERKASVASPPSRVALPVSGGARTRMSKARPIARQMATSDSNSGTGGTAAQAMEIPPPTASPTAAVEDSLVTPPRMAEGASMAAVPALPAPAPADVTLRPAPAATAPENVSPGRLLTRIEPNYPAAAREAHIQGSVVLSAHIGKDGRVTDVRTLAGNSLLAAAAADAVRQWVYTPYTLNGQAVEVDTKIVVKFAL